MLRKKGRPKGRRPKFIGIYEIRSLISNKVYIGSSKDICIRWNSHIWNMFKSNHICKPLAQELKIHGFHNFTFRILKLLDLSTPPNIIREIEQRFIDKYPKEQLFNINRARKVSSPKYPPL